MLAPDIRALLLDALRPPAGTRLQRAIGTTFTLDLATALTVPLAFAGYSLTNKLDPILAMDGIRRSGDAIDIFCQAGGIAGGRWPSDLVALMESVVHEIPRPRQGHLFHPKVWVAHYADDGGFDCFRILVLSRNLTPDRGWDLIVRLDGEQSKTINRDNDGLTRFVAALPDMAKQPLPETRRAAIKELAERLRRVVWELPDGTSGVQFWSLGLPKTQRPNLYDLFAGYRHLVISPFVTTDGLDLVVRPLKQGSAVTIISRAEELNKLQAGALDGWSVHIIDPLAGLEGEDTTEDPPEAPKSLLSALHAKIIVVERNHGAHAFFGSANATSAAFKGNVEFMVEFKGGPSRLGVDAFVGPSGLESLLQTYDPPAAPVIDEVQEAGRQLEELLFDTAQLSFRLTVEADGSGWHPSLATEKPVPVPPAGVTLFVAPFNRPAEQSPMVGGKPLQVDLGTREGADLTPFLILTARTTSGKQSVQRSAVVFAEMVGGPADRLNAILVRQIDTPEKFLQFLLLLLGFSDSGFGEAPTQSGGTSAGWDRVARLGILELLVRALATDPSSIDRLDEMVQRLRAPAKGPVVLPAGWSDLWPTVIQARKLLASDS